MSRSPTDRGSSPRMPARLGDQGPATGSTSRSRQRPRPSFSTPTVSATTRRGDGLMATPLPALSARFRRRRRSGARPSSGGTFFVLPYLTIFLLMIVIPLAMGLYLSTTKSDLFGVEQLVSVSPISPSLLGRCLLPADGLEHLLLRAADRAGAGADRNRARAGAQPPDPLGGGACARSSSPPPCFR